MFIFTWEGTFLGGSIRMEGSHSPGGNTVTWSRNSSMPATKSLRSLALYATSWKTCEYINICVIWSLQPEHQFSAAAIIKNSVSNKGKLFLDHRWNSCLRVFAMIPMYDDVGWQSLCFYFHTSQGTTTSYKEVKHIWSPWLALTSARSCTVGNTVTVLHVSVPDPPRLLLRSKSATVMEKWANSGRYGDSVLSFSSTLANLFPYKSIKRN